MKLNKNYSFKICHDNYLQRHALILQLIFHRENSLCSFILNTIETICTKQIFPLKQNKQISWLHFTLNLIFFFRSSYYILGFSGFLRSLNTFNRYFPFKNHDLKSAFYHFVINFTFVLSLYCWNSRDYFLTAPNYFFSTDGFPPL